MEKERKSQHLKSAFAEKLTNFIFYFSILFFLVAFNFQDTRTGGWVQQFIPNTNGMSIQDIVFLDSLNGFITHPYHIIRTTNRGTNWYIQVTDSSANFHNIQFKGNAGYIRCYGKLYKTTNSGNNWFYISIPTAFWASDDMSVLNPDTLFITATIFGGGLFKSTNGGINWFMLEDYMHAPGKIYMVDDRVGFGELNNLQKTTNGGYNFSNLTVTGYRDIHFLDTLYGWKTHSSGAYLMKTTNGGFNWTSYNLVPIGYFPSITINSTGANRFTLLKGDSLIWGFASTYLTYPNGWRGGYISKSTNGGLNWGFQIPDTSYRNDTNKLYPVLGTFTDINHGWAYCLTNTGVNTSVGGNDTTYYITTGINNENQNILAKNFILYQNYPNPFNSISKIKYTIKNSVSSIQYSEIKLVVYDMLGKEITVLVNEKKSAGEYSIQFDAGNLSSGIYFYKMEIWDEKDNYAYDVKKMILLK